MRVEQRQDARGVGADGVAHAGVEAVVDVGEDQVQVGLGAARLLELRRSTPPACGGRDRRGNRGTAREASGGRNSSSGSNPAAPGTRRARPVHRGEARGLAAPSSDSKYSSARLTPSQSKRATRSRTPAETARKQSRLAQVHELAPVELRVLADGGLLAPLGMIGPELLADVRQFEPGVDQDAFAVAGVDQASRGTRPVRRRVRRSARRRRAGRRCRPCASGRRSSRDRRGER